MPRGVHNAKPTAVLELQGTKQPCRHNARSDNSVGSGEPEILRESNDWQAYIVDLVKRQLPASCLRELDSAQLDAAGRWYAEYRFWEEQDRTHTKRFANMKHAWEQFYRVSGQFAMNPIDRVRLSVPDEPDELDPLAEDVA
jgi:poly(3-hydroxybutyrate) depolymerase